MFDLTLVKPFINSALNAFSTMALTVPKVGAPYYKNGIQLNNIDVSAIIGLTGKFSGWLALCFQKQAAFLFASNLLSETKTTLDSEVQDAIAEVTNIVAGGAKAEFFELGYHYKIATPTVVLGDNHVLVQENETSCIVVPFELAAGSFSLLICVKIDHSV